MIYYEHHLGDYARDTSHLNMLEDAAYRRLLDVYYGRERPLPADVRECCKLARAQSKQERDAVVYVLKEFFELLADGHRQARADREIARYLDKQAKAKRSAEARWKPRETACQGNANASADAMRTHTEGNALQSPIPNNQSPEQNDAEARRLGLLRDEPEPEQRKAIALDPAADIAIELRNLGVKITSMHPTLLQWIKDGFTKQQIIDAVGAARISKPAPAPIPPNYLTPILNDAKNPKHNATAAAREAWLKVMTAVRRGEYSKAGFTLGTDIDKAVREIGGYSSIGRCHESQLLQIERDFRKAFQQQRAAA